MDNVFSSRMSRIAGRPESGSWLQTTLANPTSGAVELIELQEHGGRLNPPGTFPVTYLAEDKESSRTEMSRWIQNESGPGSRFVTLMIEIHLSKVLDLCDASVRKTLGVSLAALAGAEDMALTQSIGVAAHHAEFEGVVYPRALGNGARNLAIFNDRASPKEISIVGAADLDTPRSRND
jgi:RES domain-containing protein